MGCSVIQFRYLATKEQDFLSFAYQTNGLSPCGLMEAPLHHCFYVILMLF